MFRVPAILQLDFPPPKLGMTLPAGQVFSQAKPCYFPPQVTIQCDIIFPTIFFRTGGGALEKPFDDRSEPQTEDYVPQKAG